MIGISSGQVVFGAAKHSAEKKQTAAPFYSKKPGQPGDHSSSSDWTPEISALLLQKCTCACMHAHAQKPGVFIQTRWWKQRRQATTCWGGSVQFHLALPHWRSDGLIHPRRCGQTLSYTPGVTQSPPASLTLGPQQHSWSEEINDEQKEAQEHPVSLTAKHPRQNWRWY